MRISLKNLSMKKSIYTYKAQGSNFSIDLDLLVDINREINENDKRNLYEHVENIVKVLHGETLRLDPQSKLDADKERDEIIGVFGGREIFVEEIPNGYNSQYYNKHLPWFIVTTNKGRIKIGWRKRVINIDWSDSIIKEESKTLFPNEDVTKFDKTIHAWGCDKAKEYIDLLLK